MAHREFKDSYGRQWDVWSVIPERAERRRRAEGGQAPIERRHRAGDAEYRVPLGDQWIHGWLAFETKGEKRRLAPIPQEWERLDDDALRAMCEQATPIKRPPRRLAE